MTEVILIDTSIYLNVLDIPNYNQDRTAVITEFKKCVLNKAHLLLPLATIWETGNHIADLTDGTTRRKYALILVEQLKQAISGQAPFRATHFPDRDEFLQWIESFPDVVTRSKSAYKQREGVSLADHAIIKEWDRARQRFNMYRVRIWSLDSDLAGFDYSP